MTTEQLRDLRAGDRVLVSPPGDLGQPPRALAPAEAVFVSFASDDRTPTPWAVVCGLPDGWADAHTEPLGLRILHLGQILKRLSDDQRIERLRERLAFVVAVAEREVAT